jgi:SOS-response transcriptional repressor LexA
MIDDGIFDGDLVGIRNRPTPATGRSWSRA